MENELLEKELRERKQQIQAMTNKVAVHSAAPLTESRAPAGSSRAEISIRLWTASFLLSFGLCPYVFCHGNPGYFPNICRPLIPRLSLSTFRVCLASGPAHASVNKCLRQNML